MNTRDELLRVATLEHAALLTFGVEDGGQARFFPADRSTAALAVEQAVYLIAAVDAHLAKQEAPKPDDEAVRLLAKAYPWRTYGLCEFCEDVSCDDVNPCFSRTRALATTEGLR